MEKEFLHIGSVVSLKNGTKKIMITGYYMPMDLKNNNKVYDYCACYYPEGVLDDGKFLFNIEQIDKVLTMQFKLEYKN